MLGIRIWQLSSTATFKVRDTSCELRDVAKYYVYRISSTGGHSSIGLDLRAPYDVVRADVSRALTLYLFLIFVHIDSPRQTQVRARNNKNTNGGS
jgi:hypothetical protein